jgi:hypothetical protein
MVRNIIRSIDKSHSVIASRLYRDGADYYKTVTRHIRFVSFIEYILTVGLMRDIRTLKRANRFTHASPFTSLVHPALYWIDATNTYLLTFTLKLR